MKYLIFCALFLCQCTKSPFGIEVKIEGTIQSRPETDSDMRPVEKHQHTPLSINLKSF